MSWITMNDAAALVGVTLPDPIEEAKITGIMADIAALITSFLGRNLEKGSHTEKIYHPNTRSVGLSNWPIISVASIKEDDRLQVISEFDVHKNSGIIYKDTRHAGYFLGKYEIIYDAGFDPIPLELQAIFKTLFKDRYTSGGAAAGASGGNIKQVSLTGVAAVTFFDQSKDSSAQGSATVPVELIPFQAELLQYLNRPYIW